MEGVIVLHFLFGLRYCEGNRLPGRGKGTRGNTQHGYRDEAAWR
ncbi:MAG: hypothetical protein ACR2OF_06495 [Hyphomicrobium sp.]